MKSRISLLLILVALCPLMARGGDVDAAVKGIRARYAEIEKATLRTETVKFESPDEPVSGTCTLGYLGDKLVKVTLSYQMGDHGGSDEYFYYQDGELVFALAVDSSWMFGGKPEKDGTASTIDSVTEHRVYFSAGKLVCHLERKASSEKAKEIRALLEKDPNKPSADEERARRIQLYGDAACRIKTSVDLGKLLLK